MFIHSRPQRETDGIVFAQPVELRIRYSAGAVQPGFDAQTMSLGKVTAGGWNPISSTVTVMSNTVAAQIGGFSTYAIIPGLQSVQFGSVPGMEARYLEWPAVSQVSMTAAPGGAVYLSGSSSLGAGPGPVDGGTFLARLNPNLSVAWVRRLPSGSLDVDPQGNVFVGSRVPGAPGDNDLQLNSYDVNGALRPGFPVTWSTSRLEEVRGLVVDSLGNAHVLGSVVNPLPNGIERIERASYVIVRNDGTVARPPDAGILTLPRGPSPTDLSVQDLAVDHLNNMYVLSSWSGNDTPAFGAHVSSFAGDPPMQRVDFPKELERLGGGLSRSVKGTAVPPSLIAVPVGLSMITAFNIASSGVQPGFPVSISGAVSLRYPVVDSASNIWILGSSRPTGNNRIWLASVSSTGQMRPGFPRVFGTAMTSEDTAFDLVVTAGGQALISGSRFVPPMAGGQAIRQIFVIRQPAPP